VLKGYIKAWRSELYHALALPDEELRLWLLILIRARFQDGDGLREGETILSYKKIEENLRRPDGKTMSSKTIKKALDGLEKRGYIERFKSGKNMVIRVIDYHEMRTSKDYERKGHELPPQVEEPLPVGKAGALPRRK
jgi:DNA-binding transcriptional regulator YhcF (GntR family)